MIISPIVLGLIFFVIFMPVGLLMRLFWRDELRLKTCHPTGRTGSHWKTREPAGPTAESFKYQF